MTKKTAAVTLIGMVATVVRVASAAAGTGSPAAAGNDLTGTWIVTVDPVRPRPPFTSLQAYTRGRSVTRGGSVLEDAAPTGRTTAYGNWEHVGGRVYAATTEFFRFNPEANGLEREHIDRRIELAPGGDSFTFKSVVTRFDQDNILIGTRGEAEGSGKARGGRSHSGRSHSGLSRTPRMLGVVRVCLCWQRVS
jgi:hypothetical protein